MRYFLLMVLAVSVNTTLLAQTISEKINLATVQLSSIDQQRQLLNTKIEFLKLEKMQDDLDKIGLPTLQAGDALVRHAALTLAYVEKYEQARWVAHIIPPDVIKGTVFRTNDFRSDAKVITGSAEESDYFLKKLKADSTWEYDGFGYDRGHLAPSADFRWSQTALSESYYYSNMSPQLAAFNRGAWGDLEDAVRGYMYLHPTTDLYVLTGPFLKDGLPKVEKETGLDFFNKLPPALQEELESQAKPADWLPASNALDVEPLAQETMPRNHFNTEQAKSWMANNTEITVGGTVVGARLSRAGNMLINLDRQFPNQVFTVFVKKEDIINFNYDLAEVLKNKVIFVKGKVINQGGTPTMYIQTQTDLMIQDR